MSEYPSANRQNCGYGIRYLRWIVDSGLVNQVGPESFAILVAVITLEDELHYSRPPNFFREQLGRRAGIRAVHSLNRARDRLIKAGLLVWKPGAKRKPAVCWVDGMPPDSVLTAQSKPENNVSKMHGKRTESDQNQFASIPDTRYPLPQVNKEKAKSGKPAFPTGLSSFLKTWNQSAAKHGLPSCEIDPPAKGAVTKFRSAMRDKELAAAIADPGWLPFAIDAAEWGREQGWFRLPDLLTRNKAGRPKLLVLRDGGYRGDAHRKSTTPALPRIDVDAALRAAGVNDD